MTVARTTRNEARTLKRRFAEDLGRVTRDRRPQRRGRIGLGSGSLEQVVEKTKNAFGRNGHDTR